MDDGSVEQWVRQAQAGDAEAFARLIQRFERLVLAVAFGVTADAHLAGDAAQEAFLRAWRSFSTLREPARFGPWLAGIARNSAIDQVRCRRGPAPQGLSGAMRLAAGDAEPPGAMVIDEERERVSAAIHLLDDLSRTIVAMRYYDDLSSRDIAELLDMSPGAVDMRLTRARQELRRRLGGMAMREQEEGAA